MYDGPTSGLRPGRIELHFRYGQVPDTGGRGSIVGGALESSNVDIATEFTNMIVLQRDYEANARVVTTVDQLSQDTINLVRG